MRFKCGMLFFCLILLLVGCESASTEQNDTTKREGDGNHRVVVKILIDKGDNSPPTVVVEWKLIDEIIAAMDAKTRVAGDAFFTEDYYRDLTFEYSDGSKRQLSFNQGGGAVFTDSEEEGLFRLDEPAKKRLHDAIERAERDVAEQGEK